LRPQQGRFPLPGSGTAVKLCKAGVMEHWMGMSRSPPHAS
jgi:hypothetical protein